MVDSLIKGSAQSRPVQVVGVEGAQAAIAALPAAQRRWLETTGFTAKTGAVGLLPGADGGVAGALLVVASPAGPWDAAGLAAALPEGDWRLDDPMGLLGPAEAALAFALASYRFERYRKSGKPRPRLVVADEAAHRRALAIASSICLARDLVNTPANDLGPDELEAAVAEVAAAQGARLTTIVGDELLKQNYPTIHAVGRASNRAPRLLDLVWGDEGAPKVTLVGKGVCFDTGGLDIKPSSGMLMMKKDMGGAGLMLGLARAVMALGLPVRLRLLIPAVENSISGCAFRPGDILKTRKGLTVEIGNTDAEGRLILCDALAEADTEKPEIMIDAATLTGAARVALGSQLPALFASDDRAGRGDPRQGCLDGGAAVAAAAAPALQEADRQPGGRPQQCRQQAFGRRHHGGPLPPGVRDREPGLGTSRHLRLERRAAAGPAQGCRGDGAEAAARHARGALRRR